MPSPGEHQAKPGTFIVSRSRRMLDKQWGHVRGHRSRLAGTTDQGSVIRS